MIIRQKITKDKHFAESIFSTPSKLKKIDMFNDLLSTYRISIENTILF
jgi:hypothetical protein